MLADKVPAVNHVNDAIMTIIRPAAGAITFAASANVITDLNPTLALVLGLLIAGGVHATKAVAVRPAVTATTGGAANVPVSILEDVVATVLSVLAVVLPVLVILFVVLLLALVAWWLWRRAQKRRAGA
jgi:tetrahydromethanopterin S-methyltransferase subunit E